MKILEMINKVNKSDEFKDDGINFDNLCSSLNIDFYGWLEQERLTAYYISSWICTDTWVGYRVYFLDDKPVAISHQPFRKSSEKFKWVSENDVIEVRDYTLSLIPNNEFDIDLIDQNEELTTYKISSYRSLFKYHKKIGSWLGVKAEILDNVDKDSYVSEIVRIKLSNGDIREVPLSEMEFPFNIIED